MSVPPYLLPCTGRWSSSTSFRAVVGPVEADPEYQLIVESNNLVVEIDNEISECDMSGHLCVFVL